MRLYSNKLKAKNITVVREFGECPPIQGWAGELKQLISNLISNAGDAMNSNGTLTVKLDCSGSTSEPQVELTVADDGEGIVKEHLERIFEPFFTTKKDVGTGLGLWVSREIVEEAWRSHPRAIANRRW